MPNYRFDLGARRSRSAAAPAGLSAQGNPVEPVVHFLRQNKRATACGRRAKDTQKDTRRKHKVTCKTCLRALEKGEV